MQFRTGRVADLMVIVQGPLDTYYLILYPLLPEHYHPCSHGIVRAQGPLRPRRLKENTNGDLCLSKAR